MSNKGPNNQNDKKSSHRSDDTCEYCGATAVVTIKTKADEELSTTGTRVNSAPARARTSATAGALLHPFIKQLLPAHKTTAQKPCTKAVQEREYTRLMQKLLKGKILSKVFQRCKYYRKRTLVRRVRKVLRFALLGILRKNSSSYMLYLFARPFPFSTLYNG